MSGDLSGMDLHGSSSDRQSMHDARGCEVEPQGQISCISLPDDSNLSRDDRWRYMSRSVPVPPVRSAALCRVQGRGDEGATCQSACSCRHNL